MMGNFIKNFDSSIEKESREGKGSQWSIEI